MNPKLYPIAFIIPGIIQMSHPLRTLLDRYDTDNEFREDHPIYPYLDLSFIFLSAGATITATEQAGSTDYKAYGYQIMIEEGSEEDFYGVVEDIMDEMFLPTESPVQASTPVPKKLQVLRGGRV
ncbi:hypothetical protein [Paenibacillus xylanexedens]|uniref:hypothetical protein n=1 Tax=Paenibacillus xylanexedens TaxID=528191 RepID=UPI0011A835EA|nr:hypothetical protein [Paenibacillus xylanexedens]